MGLEVTLQVGAGGQNLKTKKRGNLKDKRA